MWQFFESILDLIEFKLYAKNLSLEYFSIFRDRKIFIFEFVVILV